MSNGLRWVFPFGIHNLPERHPSCQAYSHLITSYRWRVYCGGDQASLRLPRGLSVVSGLALSQVNSCAVSRCVEDFVELHVRCSGSAIPDKRGVRFLRHPQSVCRVIVRLYTPTSNVWVLASPRLRWPRVLSPVYILAVFNICVAVTHRVLSM